VPMAMLLAARTDGALSPQASPTRLCSAPICGLHVLLSLPLEVATDRERRIVVERPVFLLLVKQIPVRQGISYGAAALCPRRDTNATQLAPCCVFKFTSVRLSM
jgi:hypothetical protein